MPDPGVIDHRKLYNAFVAALESELGRKEGAVIHAIIGFESGGPPDLLLFRNPPEAKGTFYVTSDLLFSERQPEKQVLYKLSKATVVELFDVGDTVDITAWVLPDCPIKGLLLTKLVAFEFEGKHFGTLLVTGLTRAELDFARERSSEELLKLLEIKGIFPVTDIERQSVL
jgi:hypothetical protein